MSTFSRNGPTDGSLVDAELSLTVSGSSGGGPSSMTQPVGLIMRSLESLAYDSSVERAAAVMRGNSLPALPISKGNEILGVVTERTLAQALARGVHPYDSVEVAITQDFPTIFIYETGAEALRRMASVESGLVVLNHDSRAVGMITASDLFARHPGLPRPPMVGGMATPFGVYLTNGAIGAGVPGLALVSTGVLMFLVFSVGVVAALLLSRLTQGSAHSALWANVWNVFPLIFLFVSMRFSPMSGIHAAEHKVVHAIERGEALVPEVVDRMPRVHPRCGTNLFAGATIFVGIYEGLLGADESLRLLLAALATFVLWRPVGSLVQLLLTTRPPNRKQIDMGIRSGKALLEKYRLERGLSPNPLQRIWNSGMIHVMAGFALCEGIAEGIGWLFHVQMPF